MFITDSRACKIRSYRTINMILTCWHAVETSSFVWKKEEQPINKTAVTVLIFKNLSIHSIRSITCINKSSKF